MSTQQEKTTGDELLLKLHEQFSENQNHHQALFIQLLIALFALFGVFGYVLIHTEELELTIKEFTPLIVFNFIENDSKELFKPIVLLGTACVVSLILLFLNIFILNNGYAYRRDQFINQRIREGYLSEDEYKKIFGENYKANNKCLIDYLPSFHNLFFLLIVIGQVFLFFIIINYVKNKALGKNILILLLMSSFFFYLFIYRKYVENIKYEKVEEEKKEEISFFDTNILPFFNLISFWIISISFIIFSIYSDCINSCQTWKNISQNNTYDVYVIVGLIIGIAIAGICSYCFKEGDD